MHPDVRSIRDPETDSDGWGICDVMIIGEAPGREEDAEGIPFVGSSGQILRAIVEDVGMDKYGIIYTNAVRCRPPDNKTPTVRQVKACAPKVLQEIEDWSPRVVILLGNTPLKAVLGESGITKWRGSSLKQDGITYIPTYHPAYILRNTTEIDTLVGDFRTAMTILESVEGPTSIPDQYYVQVVSGAADLMEMYRAIKEAGVAAWDTESRDKYMYRKGAKMLLLSFAVDKPRKRAWTVFPDVDGVQEVLSELFQSGEVRWIGHNSKYDMLVLKAAWGIEIANVVGDSMLASFILDSQKGIHGLKELAGRYLGMYEYDRPLREYHAANPKSDPSKGGDNALVPMELLVPYAALDALATLELHKILYKKLSKVQKALYNEIFMGVTKALFHVESNGVEIDECIVERRVQVYADIQAKQLSKAVSDKTVKRFGRDRQRRLDEAFQEKYAGKKTRAKPPVFSLNLNSDYQMRELLFGEEYFGLEVLGKTDTGLASTKWDYLEPFAPKVPFLKAFRYYSLLDKMLGTYLRPALGRRGADGRTRSTYKIHGTETGRLSSEEPNLQNIPTPEKEPDTVLAVLAVKDIFTCTDWKLPQPVLRHYARRFPMLLEWLGPYFDKGGVVLSADYSGMELRAMAAVAHCKGMLEVFARGEDLHRIVSSSIFKVPIGQVTKEMRYKGKWTSWTLLYGGDEHTLKRLYDIPLKDGERFIKVYYGMFPEILEYQKWTKEAAHDQGYVDSPYGFRRYFPYINDKDQGKMRRAEREAINHPIQNAAACTLNMAMVVLDDRMQEAQLRSMIVNTVHDSLMEDTPFDEMERMAELTRDSMEHIIDVYAPVYFPHVNVSWFQCPLVADIEIGSHYGTLWPYEELFKEVQK